MSNVGDKVGDYSSFTEMCNSFGYAETDCIEFIEEQLNERIAINFMTVNIILLT